MLTSLIRVVFIICCYQQIATHFSFMIWIGDEKHVFSSFIWFTLMFCSSFFYCHFYWILSKKNISFCWLKIDFNFQGKLNLFSTHYYQFRQKWSLLKIDSYYWIVNIFFSFLITSYKLNLQNAILISPWQNSHENYFCDDKLQRFNTIDKS